MPPISDTPLDSEQRFNTFIQAAVEQQQVWILSDDQGCVMLNTDDEECVPVWPSEETAQAWATGDWQHCQAQSISLKTWQHRWTPGLEEDLFHVVVFPIEQEDGSVIHPAELDTQLRKAIKARNKGK